ncbi:SH3-like domain-containing protein [Streptomyces sp. VRA16 Mangrove soil]|uniref:SH3-like domain-containing protein n=1 Tax=Streptomyces sp. VRA16 Mangrove soil TaxID=2817434 RepID=UPI001A9CCC20|nr:SH3-like domain-containing protein [Streptomyces sp. VRA16 Mangrove soil]MBO1334385.1 nitrile hydratase subunit beta [Streptomyces sp. VRA16 Mangrove soil]
MTARFALNDKVRIADRDAPGHVRTPLYARGKEGRIERVLPRFLNPEREAYGVNEGGEVRLYRVRIEQAALWPDYDGPADDVLELEIYEHWLEQPDGHRDTEGR